MTNIFSQIASTMWNTLYPESVFAQSKVKDDVKPQAEILREKYNWISEFYARPGIQESKFKMSPEVRQKFGFQGKGYIAEDSRLFSKYLWDQHNKETLGFCEWNEEVEGPPGCVHGGCISAVMDELLGSTVISAIDEPAVTVNLNVNYRKFIPLNSAKKLHAVVEKREGRKVFVKGTISDPDGTIHADGTAIFVTVKEKFGMKSSTNQEQKD